MTDGYDSKLPLQAHKFVLGSSSPVLYKLLFELEETADNPDRRLILDPSLGVTLTLSQVRLTIIAAKVD